MEEACPYPQAMSHKRISSPLAHSLTSNSLVAQPHSVAEVAVDKCKQVQPVIRLPLSSHLHVKHTLSHPCPPSLPLSFTMQLSGHSPPAEQLAG